MFDSLFEQLGVAWTAATLGTLLVPILVLGIWQTVEGALSTPAGKHWASSLRQGLSRHHP